MILNNTPDRPNLGMVASRKCPHCGHSEIGYTTPDGSFHPLKPGTLITVTEPADSLASGAAGSPVLEEFLEEDAAAQGDFKPWVPDVLKGNQKLRVKYGVMVREKIANKGLTGHEYRSAFLRKIEELIEKEIYTPLPIILDRFFSAPHLASGNPRQIALAMWRDLEEIQKPVFVVTEWLEKQNNASLSKMIHPLPISELGEEAASDKDLEAELKSLALEQFLDLL
jgi:hypothetical protein